MELSDLIISYLGENPQKSSREIYESLTVKASYATVKRVLQKLIDKKLIAKKGQGKATVYSISPTYQLLNELDLDQYFKNDIDDRLINDSFNFNLIPNILSKAELFSKEENKYLNDLQQKHESNVISMSSSHYNNEMTRLAIDLSWKSSQIEGNTYSLLETERLLMEKETAEGKTKDEAVMLLNHKKAIDIVVEDSTYILPLKVSKIENIHAVLVKELNIDKNLRKRRVGISGTNYTPLDNEFQIREALEQTCLLINERKDVFEKVLLALMLISYIQPFEDGNKRTSRIVSNAILLAHHFCPISFRTVNSIDYKKAMLLFYEKNNITAFKKIFIEQFEFAVNTYF